MISFCPGEPPVDPSVGFLPPNNDTDGQGYVTFTVRPKQQVSSLSRIDARATIIFDQNEPIDTPPIFNTVHIHSHEREKYTLMLLLIARTKFSDFSDQRHYC